MKRQTTEERFFTTEHCERCHEPLEGLSRILSWFTNETICMTCSSKEDDIKAKLRKAGLSDMEGCGYIPEVENTIDLRDGLNSDWLSARRKVMKAKTNEEKEQIIKEMENKQMVELTVKEQEEYLKTAEVRNIRPLKAGTGYNVNMVLQKVPDAEVKEVLELLRKEYFSGRFEIEAIENVIKKLLPK